MGNGWSCEVSLCFSFSISRFVKLQKLKHPCFNKGCHSLFIYTVKSYVWTQPLLQQPHIQKTLTLKYCTWNLFMKNFTFYSPHIRPHKALSFEMMYKDWLLAVKTQQYPPQKKPQHIRDLPITNNSAISYRKLLSS